MIPEPTYERFALAVRHTTRLAYASTVMEGHSEVRKTPADTGLQQVILTRLDVSPAVRVRSHRDYFGNVVHHFNLLEPHDVLEIRAESVVETSDAICCGPEAEPDPRPWTEFLAEFRSASPFVPFSRHYETVPCRVSTSLDADGFLEALLELGETFTHRFAYDREATDVDSGPDDFFEAGGGVCQDMTHAALGVLRLHGVPCRYAAGYLFDPAAQGLHGTAASHAWVQAWHPDLGWVGVDPANGTLVNWQYVRVAVGRDYGDVRPTRGVFTGPDEHALSVEVEVRRIAGRA